MAENAWPALIAPILSLARASGGIIGGILKNAFYRNGSIPALSDLFAIPFTAPAPFHGNHRIRLAASRQYSIAAEPGSRGVRRGLSNRARSASAVSKKACISISLPSRKRNISQ